jgi:hypothetical protein
MVAVEHEGGIAVAVRGPVRGSEGRVLSDAAGAAAWIDAWARDDLEVATWGAAPSVTPVIATVRDASPPQPANQTPWIDRVSLSASYEHAWTNDGSSWDGAGASACVRVGFACIGARARAAFEPELRHEVTGAKRSDIGVLATVSVPLRLGQMAIAPELGLGVGRFNTRRIEGCESRPDTPPPDCRIDDPSCPPPPAPEPAPPDGACDTTTTDASGVPLAYVGDGFENSTYAPRISIALRIAVPLVRYLWLDGVAAVTHAPFSHGDPFMALPPNSSRYLELPGEPARGVQLGIGLRIGAP